MSDICYKILIGPWLTMQLLVQMQAMAMRTATQPLEGGGSWMTTPSGRGPAVWSAPPWRADAWSLMWTTTPLPCRSALAS